MPKTFRGGTDSNRFLLHERISKEHLQIGDKDAQTAEKVLQYLQQKEITLQQNPDNIPWYTGEPLLEYLETVDVREKSEEEGFYMPVQRVCRPNHTFRGFQGQIESGQISVGDDRDISKKNTQRLRVY